MAALLSWILTLALLALVRNGGRTVAETTEAAYVRDFFYVGGHYEAVGSSSNIGGHVMRGQMYVERLRPVAGVTQPYPVLMIHGMGMTGTNFLNKPDGGRGWASDFISQGYEVYLVDQTSRGRSPSSPDAKPASFTVETVQDRFTATRLRPSWPQAGNHSQWPGSGLKGDTIFDAFFASTVPSDTDNVPTMQQAGIALLDRIGRPVVALGHSQGGIFPLLMADARPRLVRAMILIEPSGPPFRDGFTGSARRWGLADVPLAYDPPVRDPVHDLVRESHPSPDADHTSCTLQAGKSPRRLVNLADKPILVVTSESSYHAPYDYCTVRYLVQAGCVRTQHVELAKVGIRGNGHMMFLEMNAEPTLEPRRTCSGFGIGIIRLAESLSGESAVLLSNMAPSTSSSSAASLFSLQGQTALVTGCTRGIGQAVAIGLAEAGADIILRDASTTATKDAVEALGRRAIIYEADMASPDQVSSLTPRIVADGHEIRILVTCAGIQRRHACETFPDSDFNQVLQVNLNAVFALCRDVGAHMLTLQPSPATGRRGSIINFASLLTFQGGLTVPAYAASKGAVGQVTKSFANEWTARGVNVNAVAPGYIETEMNTALLDNPERLASINARIPAGRWGAPDDFKGSVVYLASRASAYVSGHTLVVDGGWMGR
ncbi:hypothetical protein L249_1796 [Ophiocordyceps polyrhachis-furcata BCC 54312]|uniref:AB hydrolase-1 domain-containing protein n=1 Tax=Ophiocordyceps polyrhachis-furcata BCC 54312 TaxID=1330021 RepID=A0A367LRP8_9HYPO|nr:hypothetical protein L249_1796 [Ophiocordyceps polyrhachis-furcata BCC 54312]